MDSRNIIKHNIVESDLLHLLRITKLSGRAGDNNDNDPIVFACNELGIYTIDDLLELDDADVQRIFSTYLDTIIPKDLLDELGSVCCVIKYCSRQQETSQIGIPRQQHNVAATLTDPSKWTEKEYKQWRKLYNTGQIDNTLNNSWFESFK
mmetsp:Transcript_32376/g.34865  ORF Transcript_32376/g.34865 Transcript_32376/m.34865 type:complete len:150 (+) Transcript_32376:109-558(+)